MAGAFAASLGAIAMATVILRGALAGEAVVDCVLSSIGSLFVFAAMGWAAGAALDYLVRQDLEQQYRRRVEWFREEFHARHGDPSDAGAAPRQDAGGARRGPS